jgi:hypothetical protein
LGVLPPGLCPPQTVRSGRLDGCALGWPRRGGGRHREDFWQRPAVRVVLRLRTRSPVWISRLPDALSETASLPGGILERECTCSSRSLRLSCDAFTWPLSL